MRSAYILAERFIDQRTCPADFLGMVWNRGNDTWYITGRYHPEPPEIAANRARFKGYWSAKNTTKDEVIGVPGQILMHVFRGHLHGSVMLRPPYEAMKLFDETAAVLCRTNDIPLVSARNGLMNLLRDGLIELKED